MLKGKWGALLIVLLVLFLVLSFAASLVFFLFGSHFIRHVIQPVPLPTPVASRAITSATLPLRELWRRTGVLMQSSDLNPPLLSAAEGAVFFVDHSREWQKSRLQVLDAATGQLRWQTDNVANTTEFSLGAAQGRLFIAVTWNIQAYDLSEGKQLWQTTGRLPGHTGYDLYPKGDRLFVYSTEDTRSKLQDVLSVYDAQSGELLDQVKTEAVDARLLWRTTHIDYRDSCEWLSAVDRASGRVIWQVAIRDCVRFWPNSVNPEKILSTRAGELFAVDIEKGEVKWRYSKRCFSNPVEKSGMVYAICEDGALVGINRETGREIGTLEFSPVGAADVPTYWLATDGMRIFAYFGDSQELIALE